MNQFTGKDPKPFPWKEFMMALFFAVVSSAVVYVMFRDQIDALLFSTQVNVLSQSVLN
jgi:hypothetical protein